MNGVRSQQKCIGKTLLSFTLKITANHKTSNHSSFTIQRTMNALSTSQIKLHTLIMFHSKNSFLLFPKTYI